MKHRNLHAILLVLCFAAVSASDYSSLPDSARTNGSRHRTGTGLFTRMLSDDVDENGRVIAVDIAKEFLDHVEATSAQLGQALNYKDFPESSVEKNIPIAASALSAIANRQTAGYGYLPIQYESIRCMSILDSSERP